MVISAVLSHAHTPSSGRNIALLKIVFSLSKQSDNVNLLQLVLVYISL